MALDRDAILNAEDRNVVTVDVPEWGDEVYIRTLTGSERDAWEEGLMQGRGRSRRISLRNIRASLCVRVLCDAEGERLFEDKDAVALGAKSARALDRVWTVAQEVNGLTEKDVEELRGNLNGDRSGETGSA